MSRDVLTNKQNVFDDFIACAEYLIKSKYTNPEKLAIEGGSNSGLLMGAALTQRPELFRAVVSHVGHLRYAAGGDVPQRRVQRDRVPERVKEAEQFKALYACSPYHHVKDGTDYPAGALPDERRVTTTVAWAMNSRKMTARLQTATHSGRPDFSADELGLRARHRDGAE